MIVVDNFAVLIIKINFKQFFIMKNIISKFLFLFALITISQSCNVNNTAKNSSDEMLEKTVKTMNASAQSVKLEQTKGAFSTTSLVLAPGQYQFEIANSDVDHEVGFVLVPKGKYDAADHIKAAYVTAPVAQGKSSMTSVVNLAAGEYEYFCPLNPTPKYALTVSDKIENVKLTQTVGKFDTENLVLAPGQYQFEIANSDVDHEVGFVLVPKGKYDAADHIKAAYVTAPVAQGKSSMTSVVNLAAGEYEYFCPLNPTPKYTLTVK